MTDEKGLDEAAADRIGESKQSGVLELIEELLKETGRERDCQWAGRDEAVAEL